MTKPTDSTNVKQFWVVLPLAQVADPGFGQALKTVDARPLYYPCLQIEPLRDYTPLDRALQEFCVQSPLTSRLLLTSPAAARTVARRLAHLKLLTSLPAHGIAILGAATRAEFLTTGGRAEDLTYLDGLESHDGLEGTAGGTSDPVGDQSQDTANAHKLTAQISQDHTILLPVADQAYEPLTARLGRLGYATASLPAYARFPITADDSEAAGDPVGNYLFQGSIDAILFTDPEQLRFFRRRLLGEGGVMSMLDHVQVYCLDGWTAEVGADYGLAHAHVILSSAQPVVPAEIVATMHQFNQRQSA